MFRIVFGLIVLLALSTSCDSPRALPDRGGPAPPPGGDMTIFADATVPMKLENSKDIQDSPEKPALDPAKNWMNWRGPNANCVANGPPAPPEFGEDKNMLWKSPIPGRGHSSPIVIGDRIYLTSADEQLQVQAVLSFDRKSGELLWIREVHRGGFPYKIHQNNTHASPTIASNGTELFAVFANSDAANLTALDFDGNILWQKAVAPFKPVEYEFGYGPSPLVYKDTVIVCSEFEEGAMVCVSQKDGTEKWRVPRKGITFSSPIVSNIAGKDQLLLSGGNKVTSYNPENGEVHWEVEGTTRATCGTMVWDGDIVFASGGYPDSQTIAVKADGSKKVLWTNRQKCYEQSLLAYGGYVYGYNDTGILYCWMAETGKEMWKKRLGGPVSSSPVISGDNIFVANERGQFVVFKPNPEEFVEVSQVRLGDNAFPTPAIVDGKMYVRVSDSSSGKRQEYLYCFGKQN